MTDHDNHHYEGEQEEERPRDPKIDEAKLAIMEIFDAEPKRVFYSVQIETKLERHFFHWITNKGLRELAWERKIKLEPRQIGGQRVHFYTRPDHRYYKMDARKLEEYLAQIYEPDFTRAVGHYCEMLLDSALARAGFMPVGKDVNEWNGIQWTESRHNLDRIVVKDGIAYGVEIKNTQNYIPHTELRIKIRLCKHLGLHPLFIMRFSPKSYTHEVYRAGGFTLLFEHQMYPLSHIKLMREVRTNLGLKIDCPSDFQAGHIQRLQNWHNRNQNTK